MTNFDRGMIPGSLELAYMGDTIYDLFVREKLVRRGGKVKNLHKEAVSYVRASAQSAAFLRIEDSLTEEEADVARRARNAHQNPPKNADAADYHRATAFAALLGYLYLTDRRQRAEELLARAVAFDNMEDENK